MLSVSEQELFVVLLRTLRAERAIIFIGKAMRLGVNVVVLEWAVVTTNANKPNQLLIEMDGFDGNENHCRAAANRSDVRPALRPGRLTVSSCRSPRYEPRSYLESSC